MRALVLRRRLFFMVPWGVIGITLYNGYNRAGYTPKMYNGKDPQGRRKVGVAGGGGGLFIFQMKCQGRDQNN